MIAIESRLRTRTLVAYGLPAMGLQATSLIASLYLLKFATEDLLIGPAVVGSMLAASRIWDAISDPLIGYASDRTKSRLGRRRPWMLIGAPLLAASFAAMWDGPGEPGALLRTAWLAFAIVAFYTSYTFVSVPHWSLGASLSSRNDERNRVYAVRGLLQNVGLLVAMVGVYFLENADASSFSVGEIGIVVGLVAGATIVIGAGFTRELPPSDDSNSGATPLSHSLRSFRDVVTNPSARLIMQVIGLQEMALAALLVVLPFEGEYVLEAPGQTAFYLLCFVIPMSISLPVWVRVGRKMNRLRAWRAGNAVEASGFLSILLAGPGDQILVGVAAGIIGIGHGASRVFAMSALAEVTAADTERTGVAKEGLYFSAATFIEKCAVALAAFAVGIGLEASGFVGGEVPGNETILMLRALASVVPAILIGMTCLLLSQRRGRETRRPLPSRTLATRQPSST